MRKVTIQKGSIVLILAFLTCTLFTWVRPGPESSGLGIADQLGYVIIPAVLAFVGIWNEKIRRGLRIALVVLGHVLLYLLVYLLIKNSGMMMNIGEIDLNETITWLTPMFYVAMGVSILSFITGLISVKGKGAPLQ